jgi:hypothetical protein
VTRGLREAFSAAEFEDIRRLTRDDGSPLVFRIVARGHPYLLKFAIRAKDPARKIACMTAAEAGLAPHVWYTSVENRIFITDFVDSAPLPVKNAPSRMPVLLRTLHALPPFPRVADHIKHYMHVPDEQQRRRAGQIPPEFSGSEHSPKRRMRGAFRPARAIGCGLLATRRFVSTDSAYGWEAAFLNDGYADLLNQRLDIGVDSSVRNFGQ